MGTNQAAPAEITDAGWQANCRSQRGHECSALQEPDNRRLVDATNRIWITRGDLLVVQAPSPQAAAPHCLRPWNADPRGSHEPSGSRAYRVATSPKGRIVIDGHGRLHLDKLTVTDINKGSGSQAILDAIIKRQPWVKHLLGDGPYDRGALVSKTVLLEFLHEVVRRIAVEQTVGHATPETVAGHNAEWLTRWRSIVRQYEARIDISDMPAWPWEETC